MLRFILTLALVYAALAVPSLLLDGAARTDNPWVLHFLASVLLVPVLSAWGVAEVIGFFSRRRILTRRAAGPAAPIVAGLVCGIAGLGLGTLGLTYLSDRLGDTLIMGLGAALPVAAVLLATPRLKRGQCRRCSYDLAGITPAARGHCPECGTDLMTAA